MTQPLRRRTLLTALAAGTAAAATGATVPTAAADPGPARKSGPVTVAYVEVNNNSMLNVGKYTLADGGQRSSTSP